MTGESAARDEADDESSDDVPENVLFDWYRQYIGEPDTRTDVYLGFGLFFSGIALAFIALVVFFVSGTFDYGSGAFWAWRRPAYALGMLSLPASMVGIVVLLPVERRALIAAGGGAAVTLVAVGVFALVYPNNWNVAQGADYSTHVVALYAVGLAGVVASTGSALVAHQLEQARGPRPGDIEAADEDASSSESVSDADVEADIESAMEDVEISWGGVEKSDTQDLNVQFGEDIETASVDVEATTTRSSGTENQMAALRSLKGGEQNTQTSESTVDDQTAKLRELREQQREEEAEQEASSGTVSRIMSKLGLE